MTELERAAHTVGQAVQKARQPVDIAPQVRRQLEEEGAEAPAEHFRGTKQVVDRVSRVLESLLVRDPA